MDCEDTVPAFVLPTEESPESAAQSEVNSAGQSTAIGVTEAMQDNILVRVALSHLRSALCSALLRNCHSGVLSRHSLSRFVFFYPT